MSSRLSPALQSGLDLPADGPIALWHPPGDADLSDLPTDRLQIIQPFAPDHDALAARGFSVSATLPEGTFAASIVFLPRAKALARHLVAQAMDATNGTLAIDGLKTHGVESLLKSLRKRMPVAGVISKAHGKLFWTDAASGLLADWLEEPRTLESGYVTAPGCFSADGPDPASVLLAETLPPALGARVVDLGAGWGYLSAAALAKAPGIETLDLVEADHAALDCARRNVTDPRAAFHWADATRWQPAAPVDTILTNPPFHTTRSADPRIGQDFLTAAAGMLKPSGRLFAVANRHLPYETTLARLFADTTEIAGNNRFKVICASRPKRKSRIG